ADARLADLAAFGHPASGARHPRRVPRAGASAPARNAALRGARAHAGRAVSRDAPGGAGSPLLVEVPFDSRWFGLRVGRVTVDRLSPAELAAVESARRARGFDCVFLLAAPDAPATLRAVAAAGFRFVDVRTTLERTL